MQLYIFEKREGIGLLTLNRPADLNVINSTMLYQLQEFFSEQIIEEKLQGLIITGAGEKAFCAGADLQEISSLDRQTALQLSELGHAVMNKIENLPIITVAAVNGFALGGGFELALTCDFILAARTALFGLPETTLGLIPGWGGTQRLRRIVPLYQAKEMIYSGRKITAEEAHTLGIALSLYEKEKLLENSRQFIEQMAAAKPQFALQQAKRAINEGLQLPFDQGLELECALFAKCASRADAKELIEKFTSKKGVK